ncbi:MAG: copper amine oxidase N-terminal domain-containing protein, partial [Fimbriimonadaceae bacterium]
APRVQDGIPLTPCRHLFEANGGKVDWTQATKEITATGDGRDIWLRIGDRIGRVNKIDVDLEIAPFIERGRTIVPLSFIQQGLNVNIEYDSATGHVFITSAKKQ